MTLAAEGARPSPSESFEQVEKYLDQALAGLKDLEAVVPAYSVESMRWLSTEVAEIRRRVTNVRRAVGS